MVSLLPSAEACPTNRAVASAAAGMDTRRGGSSESPREWKPPPLHIVPIASVAIGS